MPWKTWLYLSAMSLNLGLGTSSSLTALMSHISSWILRSFFSASVPSSLICNIPSSCRVSLTMSGGELILPLTTINLATVPQVLFLIVAVNSPFTDNSLCKVFSFVLLDASVGFVLARFVSALN